MKTGCQRIGILNDMQVEAWGRGSWLRENGRVCQWRKDMAQVEGKSHRVWLLLGRDVGLGYWA